MKKQPQIFGKPLHLSWTELIIGGAMLVLGLVLLIWPNIAVSLILNGIGIICIVLGLIHVLRYMKLSDRQSITNYGLAIGLTWICGGVLVIALKGVLISILPFFCGVIILLGGIAKIQGALSFKRMEAMRWYLELVVAAVSIVLGVLILFNPFSTGLLLMRFIGGALIIEAVSDVISKRAFVRTKEKFFVEFEQDD